MLRRVDFGLVVVTMVICGCGRPPEDQPEKLTSKTPPIKQQKANTAPKDLAAVNRAVGNITALYGKTCASCHGQKGEGNGSTTKSLITHELYDQKCDRQFYDAIVNGVPGMEGYRGKLDAKDMWALVVHIRELQRTGFREQGMAPKVSNGVYESKYYHYALETYLDAGEAPPAPWGVDWLPDGRMLITAKDGKLYFVEKHKLSKPISGLPAVHAVGQGALMDVAVHPNYAKNGWIYLSFSDPIKSQKEIHSMTKIVRGKIKKAGDGFKWANQQTIFKADRKYYAIEQFHYGSRIVFDKSGHVYFSVGERGKGPLVSDPHTPYGKIFRLNDDGSYPRDNPYAERKGKAKGVWSTGHRNPQGLAFDLEGNLWDTEHGPRGGDEVNLIKKRAYYGWPAVTFGINYNDSKLATPWPQPGQNITMPVFRWLPSIGSCGLDVVKKGSKFSRWEGDLLASGLAGQNVDRLRMKNGQLVEREELIYGLGRVRDIACGPDGYIYIVLTDPGKVLRIIPKS